jgi:hypothetical protein
MGDGTVYECAHCGKPSGSRGHYDIVKNDFTCQPKPPEQPSERELAERRIQELLAEVVSLADKHKIEFKFLGCTMHYYRWSGQEKPAKKGLLVSDEEWESSNCYGPVASWEYAWDD